MNVRIVNLGLYVCMGIGFWLYQEKRFANIPWWSTYQKIMKGKMRYVQVLLVFNTISLFVSFIPEETSLYVERGRYGEEQLEVPLLLTGNEGQKELVLEVEARKLKEEELQQRVEEAFVFLEKNMQGENDSLKEVRKPLNYELDFQQFPFEATFVSDDYSIVDSEGKIHNDKEYLLSLGYQEKEIEKGIPVKIQVVFWYGERSFEREYEVTVFEKESSPDEEKAKSIQNKLEKIEEEAVYEEGFYIPAVIDGVEIKREDVTKIKPGHVLILGMVILVLFILRDIENDKKKQQERRDNLARSYSWFINEMVLLLGAGMQVRNIFLLMIKENERDCADYRKPLLREIEQAVHSFELGVPEGKVYYQLGRNIGLPCYIKVMTLLEQNGKHGGKGLTAAFEQEEIVALEQRKNMAKRYGEEAGTKLLGPMVLLLLVIMLMIMIPAFWSFA